MRQWTADNLRTPLLVFVGGFLVGVGLYGTDLLDMYMATALLVGAVVLTYGAVQYSFHGVLYAVLVVLACIVGYVRIDFAERSFERGLTLTEGAVLERKGTVRSEPDIRETHTILTVALDTLEGDRSPTVVRVRVPHYPNIGYGERVGVRGTITTPEAFETETGRIFRYREYLMKDGVHYEIVRASVTPLNEEAGNAIVRTLLEVKLLWLTAVSRTVPEPAASLLGGVVVGAKRSLGEEWLDAFRATGIVHIVVLSGYNLTLVALFVVYLTRRFSRTTRLVGGVLAIIAFALMTGGGATVVRASTMAILGMLALFLARPYAVTRALIIAAFGMVFINPFLLAYDPGFQLSFVATLGLIFGTPVVERWLSHVTAQFGLRTILATTLATQCAVLPLLLYQVGEVSLVSPLVNVLVLPVVPFIMGAGFVTGVVGMLNTTIALPFAWVTGFGTTYIFKIVDMFASLPVARIELPPVHLVVVAVLYTLLAVYLRHMYTQKPYAVFNEHTALR